MRGLHKLSNIKTAGVWTVCFVLGIQTADKLVVPDLWAESVYPHLFYIALQIKPCMYANWQFDIIFEATRVNDFLSMYT